MKLEELNEIRNNARNLIKENGDFALRSGLFRKEVDQYIDVNKTKDLKYFEPSLALANQINVRKELISFYQPLENANNTTLTTFIKKVNKMYKNYIDNTDYDKKVESICNTIKSCYEIVEEKTKLNNKISTVKLKRPMTANEISEIESFSKQLSKEFTKVDNARGYYGMSSER